MSLRAIALLAALSGAAPAQSPSAAQIAALVTAGALKADVSFLASDALEGRGTPSRGLDIAAEYIASRFRGAGLVPAGDDGYFATASFESVTPNFEGLELKLEAGGKSVHADIGSMALQEAAAVDLSHTPAVTATLDDAEALDALTPGQVRGKVLVIVIPPGAPHRVMRGIPAAAERLEPVLVVSVRASGSGMNHAARLRDPAEHTRPCPILSVWDPDIRDAAEAGGALTVSAHIAAPEITPVKLRNVIGVLRGSDPAFKDSYLMVTAHYDHLGMSDSGDGDSIYNGANDDASGTASVIEVASALSALGVRPKRSIVFLTFFGEELDELGSHYYMRHPIFPLGRTVADINLEQLGRTDDDQGPHVGMVNLTGFDFTDMPAVFARAGEQAGIRVVKDDENADLYFSASDNAAFAEAGVPATSVSVTYEFPDYHQPGDEWPKLDYQNMARVDVAIALAICSFANSATAPRWNAENPKTAAFVKARGK